MPLTPIAGVSRLRAFQMGIEGTFKTQVPATRRLPWAFVPAVDPHWTASTADTGTLDLAIAPWRLASDITGTVSNAELFGDDVPTIISMGVMGGLPLGTSGTAKTFTAQPASTSQDVFDTYTAEAYDDATADSWAFTGGILESFTLDYPQNLGPILFGGTFRFAANAPYPATPTGALNVDLAPVPMFAADTEVYINDTSGAIETTKLSDIFYDSQLSYTNNIDVKRFQNGSNSRFEVANYGRGERVIQFTAQGAKQTSWLNEAAKWIGQNPTERFFGIKTTSPVLASVGIPYSLDIRFPGYWMTRAWTTVNTNTAFQLVSHQVYDPVLGYAVKIASVSKRAAL